MRAYTKVRVKLFLLDLLFEIVVNGAIFAVAYYCDKVLYTALFYIPFHILRYAFPKIYHAKGGKPVFNILKCLLLSCLCFFSAMKLSIPLYISIFSSVLAGILINYILYVIQDRLEMKYNKSKTLYELCCMTEDNLRKYARSLHISESLIDTLVLRLTYNYRWCDIQQELNYTKEGIRYHKQTLERKLGIKL